MDKTLKILQNEIKPIKNTILFLSLFIVSKIYSLSSFIFIFPKIFLTTLHNYNFGRLVKLKIKSEESNSSET